MGLFSVGEKKSVSKTISEIDVYDFARLSGDYNPVHVNKEAAEKSIFGKQIVHGMLAGSLFSNVIGMEMPGPGTIYMEQDLRFLKPVYIGDTITACVEISEIINERKGIIKLSTIALNQEDTVVIEGYAVVKVMKEG